MQGVSGTGRRSRTRSPVRIGHTALVTDDEFPSATLAIMQNGTPSADDNLLGMQIDFDIRLGELDQVDADSVLVQRAEHAERPIRASCKPAGYVNPGEAVEAIRQEWLTNLRYPYAEAHRTLVTQHGATLDFVTQMAPGGLYVTGQVEVRTGG